MIQIESNGNTKELAAWVEPPGIYLDHWAIRLFSEDEAPRTRLLAVLDAGGTVLVSIMNIVEIAGNTDKSADNIRDFLKLIGSRWYPISVSPQLVADREDAFQDGMNAPALGDALVQDEKFRRQLLAGEQSLASVVDLTRGPDGEDLREQQTADEAKVVAGIEAWREEYKKDPKILDAKWPLVKLSPDKPMRPIYNRLIRLCIKDSFVFDDNDVRDLLHTAVPMAYADYLLLDPHWAAQVVKVRRQLELPDDKPRVFTKASVNEFLTELERAARRSSDMGTEGVSKSDGKPPESIANSDVPASS